MSNLWRPLLEGDLAARAWEAVDAIARSCENRSSGERGAEPLDRWLARRISLGDGAAGQALFYGYLAATEAAGPHAARSEQLLGEAVEALATVPMPPSLYFGFTGIAWAAEHLSRLAGPEEAEADEDDDPDSSEEIDQALLAVLDRVSWKGGFDLLSGLVGFGVYALERLPHPTAVHCLEVLVDRLAESAERQGQEVTWHTSPEVLPSAARNSTPCGYYDLGVAHGVPGVIAFLAEACRLGIRQERARLLLEGAIPWLLRQSLPGPKGSGYPSKIGPGLEARPGRLAWCQGDPGIAATLLCAARAVGREEWEQAALAIAARAAGAAPEDAGVVDIGLCHGAFGLAHLYNRISQAGGGELFAQAARRWYRLGLGMHDSNVGLTGEVWHPFVDMRSYWEVNPGFLTGAAGVGLALLAAVTPIPPEWDRLLLVAIPSRPSSR